MDHGCWPEAEFTESVNDDELGNLKLSDEQEDAIVAFLKTLSDGYMAPRYIDCMLDGVRVKCQGNTLELDSDPAFQDPRSCVATR
jgi:hypothetical protein